MFILVIFAAQVKNMKITAQICALLIAVNTLISCGDTAVETEEKVVKKDSVIVEAPQPLAYDTLLTESSQFIAGLSANLYLADQQSKDFYKEHQTFCDNSWTTTNDSMLSPIKDWCKANNIGDDRDSVLCFYPLSGPDFLFGNAFFPNADNFVLLGLEPRGSMCDFRTMKDDELKRYLSGVRASMKYINTRGYFVTSHMSSDFTKYHLNGMVHMILYMMARTNHPIVDVYNVYLDSSGKEVRFEENPSELKDKLIAIKVEYLSPDRMEKRNLYYFKLDAADENLNVHTEFEKFVDGFGPRVAYMKSASCVLQNTPFSVMRRIVLNSDKILQDDTGVPYKYFTDDTTLTINLYGTYTTTIDDLSWCLQPALRKDVSQGPNNKKLPFEISYNGNYGEGVMIWAVRKK